MSSYSLRDGVVFADRYRITSPLGFGAYGAVYQAVRLADEREVALKIMHAKHQDTTDALRFDREAALLQRLRDPHVVEILDFGHHEELPYLVFELLHGCTVAQQLDQAGPLGMEQAARVARQILAALRAAHALNIVHRDIKPANIFLCEGPAGDYVKVLDFGTAKALGEDATQALTATGQMLGTAQYMAPEQVRGEPVDHTADIYSLGAVTAEMVTGGKLVTGDSVIDVYMRHISAEPLTLPNELMSSPLGPIIARAVAKAPASRYQTADAMAVELDALIDQLPPPAPQPAPVIAPYKELIDAAPEDDGSRVWLVVAVSLLCVLAGVGAALMLL